MTEQKSFEQTALPHMTALRNFAMHLTNNAENANDLVQDTYFNAFRCWNQFQRGTNIKGWLYQIMKNISINRHRKEIKEPRRIRYEEYHLPYNTAQETLRNSTQLPEEPYNEVFGDEVVRSIQSIHDNFRNAVLLCDLHGFNYDEIARLLNCPVGTVRSRMYRGRKILKKKLLVYARKNGYVSEHHGSR